MCVKQIDATGLNLFASAIKKRLSTPDISTVEVEYPTDTKASTYLSLLGGNEVLPSGRQPSLFNSGRSNTDAAASSGAPKDYPSRIIHLENHGATARDKSLGQFRSDLKNFLEAAGPRLNRHQLLLIFSEMAKNTLDHSERDASIGIDIQQLAGDRTRLRFSYCEQGLGLSRSLRKHLRDSTQYTGRANKGGLSDLIHWALQPGNSTKSGNGVNFGLGMSMILAGANGIDLMIEMVDAASSVALSGIYDHASHHELRRRFVSCADFPCFSYVGELTYG